MLEGIFGNATAEKVLLYVERHGEAYPSRVAQAFDEVAFSMAWRQLARFEQAGLLVSRSVGRTRLFSWNPDYPFLGELRALLRKALRALPPEERERFRVARREPAAKAPDRTLSPPA